MKKKLGLALLCTAAASMAQVTVPPDVTLTQFATGLSSPVALRNAGDGSNRLFVAQQGGAIRILSSAGALNPTPFLTINGSTQCQWSGNTVTPGFTSGGERGLLSLAFHPSYTTNGRFFVNFTDGAGDTVVARFNRSAGDANLADPASCVILFRVDQDFANHNGGNVLFGPDGFLYIGMGDGGSGGDPCERAQSLRPAQLPGNDGNNASCPADTAFVNSDGNAKSRALLGKMLRIDVDGTTPAGHRLCGVNADDAAQYSIPAANFFGPTDAGNGDNENCRETFAYGLRNPWRFSFDRDSGDLVIGDVGQGTFEEITFQRREASGLRTGLNHGWRCFEGEATFNGNEDCTGVSLAQTHDPVLTYGGAAGSRSVTGGYIYRGPVISLRGFYIFADQINSEIFFAQPVSLTNPGASQPNWAFTTRTGVSLGLAQNPANTATFGEDETGNLYIVGYSNGLVARFSGTVQDPDVLFRNGFE
jgi:glucose/arabinose dehydrogenase